MLEKIFTQILYRSPLLLRARCHQCFHFTKCLDAVGTARQFHKGGILLHVVNDAKNAILAKGCYNTGNCRGNRMRMSTTQGGRFALLQPLGSLLLQLVVPRLMELHLLLNNRQQGWQMSLWMLRLLLNNLQQGWQMSLWMQTARC